MAGFLIILMGLFAGLITSVFKRVPNQATTLGEIVSLEFKALEREEVNTRYAWVEYEVDGKVYSIKSRTRSSNYFVGDKMIVAYDKSNPQNAFIKPKTSTYVIMLILIGIGVIALINPELVGF